MQHSLFDLAGKVALVTGGNRGIGRAIALGLASAGARVVVAARDSQRTADTVKDIEQSGGQALGVSCDVTDRASIEAAVTATEHAFGGLQILVNNAGISGGGPPAQIPEEIWDRVIETNLKGSFQMAQAAHRLLRLGGGKVINLGSEYSLFGSGFVAPYSASKGGVIQLTKSLAIAWAADRIQVNALIPGWIRTDMTAPVERMESFYRSIVQRTPAGRFGEPDELAGAAIFLASRASDFVTGIAIPVDGGYAAA